jgi:phosphoglycolate phosphatase
METASLNRATLVFDLDGTLVDTAPDLTRALNHTLALAGCGPRPEAEVLPFISFGARRMIVEGLAASQSPRGDAEVDALMEKFLEHYSENVAIDSRPFPGVVDILDAAHAAGATLAVCTNKMERLTKLLLAELEMDHLFHAIAGRDTLPVCKPDPEHLLGAVRMAGGEGQQVVMVGDSATDVKTAKAAGVPSIVVSFGYTEIPPRDLGADAVIDDYGAFWETLESLLPAKV